MRMRELRRKEVINITDGGRLGFVGDVDFHLPEGQAAALIIYGPARFFGLFGKGEEYYVPWTASSGSGTTSSSSISPPSTGTRLWSGSGGNGSENRGPGWKFRRFSEISA